MAAETMRSALERPTFFSKVFAARRFVFIGLIIVLLISVTTLIGASETDPAKIIASFIATTLAVATPLTLGALSGVFCERAGVVNIAIEGMMLGAAFFGFIASIYSKQAGASDGAALLIGVMAAMLSGMLFALLHAMLSITFKVNQIISGTVINILAVGLTGYLNRILFFQGNVPHAPGVLPTIAIPILSDIPIFGRIFTQQPIAFTAVALVFVSHFVLFHTQWGLRMRAVGEHPRAADTVGINVYRVRYANVLIGGVIAGSGRGVLHAGIGAQFRADDDQRSRLHRAGGHDLRQLVAGRGVGGGPALWRGTSLADQPAIFLQRCAGRAGLPEEVADRRHAAVHPDDVCDHGHRRPHHAARRRWNSL